MAFAMLTNKFKTNVFVIYCDQKKNKRQYEQILKALIKARKEIPINLKPTEDGELKKQQRHSDVLFVLSTVKNLMPVAKLHDDKPQALFITPEDKFLDLTDSYLKDLEKFEGLPKEEFFKKAINNEKEFAYDEKDNDTDRNKKDTLKLVFSPDRFVMSKMYHTEDLDVITHSEKIA